MSSPPSSDADLEVEALARSLRTPDWLTRLVGSPPPRYVLTRVVFLRALGLIYLVAFTSLYRQLLPLLGSHGLLPIRQFLAERLDDAGGSRLRAAMHIPSVFWLGASDATLSIASAIGIVLSIALVSGATNALLQLALWALYLSFIDVGQIFYGYGWESLLVEAGFLSIFLCPVRSIRPFRNAHAPPATVFILLRWLAFRLMFGAGLIKLRGDPCWRDLTCLAFHYETQPVPGPLSPAFHSMPLWFHKGGAIFNHFVELVVPWFVFGPRRVRHVAGCFLVAFQLLLIASGNLSFLNWLTLVVCLACFDDHAFGRVFSKRLRALADSLQRPTRLQSGVAIGLAVVVAALSFPVVVNMLSPRQRMNASFEPLRIVNTYGAFGSVGRVRLEVVISGTRDVLPDERAHWYEYEFPCKPGNVRRRPCWITPYHYRLDWQMWFAAMSSAPREPWFMHLVWKLLRGDRGVRSLFAYEPFGGGPVAWIRADLYVYRFRANRRPGDPWWERRRVGTYLPPVSLNDPDLRAYIDAYGWTE